jgi:hypothetical protein
MARSTQVFGLPLTMLVRAAWYGVLRLRGRVS